VTRNGARLVTALRSALRGIRGSAITSAVAVVTIGSTLVLVGAFALVVTNMEGMLQRFGDALSVTAFFAPDATVEVQRRIATTAATIEGVESVRLVTKAEALERFRRGVGRGAALLEGLNENPLPASLEVTLAPPHRSAEGLTRVAGSLDGLPGLAELHSGQDWVEGYLRAVNLVRGIGWGLGLVLGLAALLIVANTIRLAVLSRRDELEILSLVGASRSFVNLPFLLEGLLQGLLGGGVALLLLYSVFRLALPGFEFGLELVLGGVQPRFFHFAEGGWLVAGGSALGLFGAGAALVSESRP
jgi:cell division transport system permease protein